jgi:hypothetical protein
MATDAEIRAWANQQGYENVPTRGSLPGWIRDAHEAYHQTGQNGNGADPFDAPPPSAVRETRPRNVKAARWPWAGGKKTGGKKKAKHPRVPVDDLISAVWGGLAGMGQAMMPATSKMMKWQAPVAGKVVEDAIEGTVIDKMLQPIARTTAAGEVVTVMLGPPLLMAAIETNPARAPFVVPILRAMLIRWFAIAGPKLEEKRQEESEFEAEYGQSVDELLDEMLGAIRFVPPPPPDAEDQADAPEPVAL